MGEGGVGLASFEMERERILWTVDPGRRSVLAHGHQLALPWAIVCRAFSPLKVERWIRLDFAELAGPGNISSELKTVLCDANFAYPANIVGIPPAVFAG